MMSGVRRKYTLHGSTLLAGSHSVTSCRLCLSVTGKPRPGPPGRLQSGTAAAFRRTLPPSGPLSIRRSAVSSLSVPFYTGSVALEGGKVKGSGEGIQEKIWLEGRKHTTFPRTTTSTNWKHWCATMDERLCQDCEDHGGKVYKMEERPNPGPPLHPYC